jgi:hypothetical protein
VIGFQHCDVSRFTAKNAMGTKSATVDYVWSIVSRFLMQNGSKLAFSDNSQWITRSYYMDNKIPLYHVHKLVAYLYCDGSI